VRHQQLPLLLLMMMLITANQRYIISYAFTRLAFVNRQNAAD
jgi:hypothetical protein